MRATRRLVATGALSALALAGIPSAGAQTPTVTQVIGAADGLFVDVDVDIVNGPTDLTFGPEPSVTLPPEGGSVSDQVASVDESVVAVSLTTGLLTAAAEGELGPDGFATAETTVADIEFGIDEGLLPAEVGAQQQLVDVYLAAELITASCEADLDGVTGSTALVGAEVLEEDISGEPEPNTELEVDIPGLATIGVTLNRQVENPDGSLSVTAVVLELDVVEPFGVTGTLEIGPATCGVVEGVTAAPEEVVPAQPVPAEVRLTG